MRSGSSSCPVRTEEAPAMTARPDSYRPVTIGYGVRTAAERTPDKIAYTIGDRALSYAALIERINKVSNLARHGFGLVTGDHAALMAPNGTEFIEITVGLAEAGIAPAMISPAAVAREIAYICNDSGAKVLFV